MNTVPPCEDSRRNHRWTWTAKTYTDRCPYCDTTRDLTRSRPTYTAGKGSGRSSNWRVIDARKAAILKELRKPSAWLATPSNEAVAEINRNRGAKS